MQQQQIAPVPVSQLLVFGTSGPGGSGKDTTAGVLSREFGFTQKAFADKVREFGYALNCYLPEVGETYCQLIDRLGYEEAKRKYPAVREYLVKIGDRARKVFYNDIWLDAVLPPLGSKQHQALLASGIKRLVVSDVRYANEAARVKEYGGKVYYIERKGVKFANETEAASLPLVKEMADAVLENDYMLEHFENMITNFMMHEIH